ncbi:hypothetical protein [Microbulbifer sp. JMSA008]|uniref:hypothetical protein n=1 Tax=Microbulbifer sp. JMSA008 TaxID=3243373 RepID=UPI0040393504
MSRTSVSAMLVLLGVATSVFLYFYKFGLGLWDDHSKWGELGSFFGGVIGPLLAAASVIYLAQQVRLQKEKEELQFREKQINKFTDIIHAELEKEKDGGKSLKDQILNTSNEKPIKGREIIITTLARRPRLLTSWINISAALTFIKSKDENIYLHYLTVISLELTDPLCSSLDYVTRITAPFSERMELHFLDGSSRTSPLSP